MGGPAAGVGSVELDFTTGGTLAPTLLRRLDTIAAREVETFNRFVAGLCVGRERDIDWWVTRPASRNVHLSPLFRWCMQLSLVRSLLEEGRHLSIRVDVPEFAAVLRSAAGCTVEVPARGALLWRLKRLRAHAWNLGSCIFHAVSAATAARLTRHLARKPVSGPLVLLDCFVTRESFSGGPFRDRHFPGVVAALSAEERRTVHYLPMFYRVRSYFRTFRALRQDPANFLVREDHLRLVDYLFAAGHWWRVRRHLGHEAQYCGFDVRALVDADLRAGRFARSAFLALLAYRFLTTAERRGLAIARLVNWYEGRDTDHATAAAVNWHRLDIALIAFRPPCSRFYLSVTPEPYEVAAGVVPTTVAVVGCGFAREIAAGNPGLAVVPAPGLRLPRPSAATTPEGEGTAVLVILPLLGAAIAGIRALIAPTGGMPGASVQWWIKRHPEMPRTEAEALFGSLPSGYRFVEGDFADWLARAAIVAGVGSSALIEAVATGRAVLCLASGNEPTENPIPPWVDGRLWRIAYSPDDVRAAVTDLLHVDDAPRDRAALRNDLLSPGEPAEMQRILGFGP